MVHDKLSARTGLHGGTPNETYTCPGGEKHAEEGVSKHTPPRLCSRSSDHGGPKARQLGAIPDTAIGGAIGGSASTRNPMVKPNVWISHPGNTARPDQSDWDRCLTS